MEAATPVAGRVGDMEVSELAAFVQELILKRESEVRDPNMVTLMSPAKTYCHSSAVGCQCSSRSAPGSSSRTAPVTVLEIGNLVESTIHSRPPLLSIRGGSEKSRYLCVIGPGCFPASGAAAFAGGCSPRAKYTSFVGKPSKVDAGTPNYYYSYRYYPYAYGTYGHEDESHRDNGADN